MNRSLNIAICEDSPADQARLISLLERSSIAVTYTLFSSGEALCSSYVPGQYDLLLVDIYMGAMTGIDAVSKIRQLDADVPVAFVTSSTDFTLEGYRLSALKYLEKPVREKDVLEMLELALLMKKAAPTLTLHKNGREHRLPCADILYLEQQIHHLVLYMKDGTTPEVCEKLSVLQPQLEEAGFFLPHKSYAVNLRHVCRLNQDLRCFEMENGDNVPIRRETMGRARQALTDYLFTRTRGGRA